MLVSFYFFLNSWPHLVGAILSTLSGVIVRVKRLIESALPPET